MSQPSQVNAVRDMCISSIVPSIVRKIRETYIPEDLELHDDEINGISMILAMYFVDSIQKKLDRKAQWPKGLKQIESLKKSSQQLHDDLRVVSSNPYISNTFMKKLPPPSCIPDDSPLLNFPWDMFLGLQVESLVDVLGEISDDESIFDETSIPEIPKIDWHKRKTIHTLNGFLLKKTDVGEQTERAAIISELLDLVGKKLSQKSIENILSKSLPKEPEFFQR